MISNHSDFSKMHFNRLGYDLCGAHRRRSSGRVCSPDVFTVTP